ncbi:hypothetical protein K1719_013489 [Acacia pycnantha]|nr:hypothetical protein K1719_013489 [Acacia pycnantha]
MNGSIHDQILNVFYSSITPFSNCNLYLANEKDDEKELRTSMSFSKFGTTGGFVHHSRRARPFLELPIRLKKLVLSFDDGNLLDNLSKLTSLESLSLFFNNFSGSIPGGLSTSLEVHPPSFGRRT